MPCCEAVSLPLRGLKSCLGGIVHPGAGLRTGSSKKSVYLPLAQGAAGSGILCSPLAAALSSTRTPCPWEAFLWHGCGGQSAEDKGSTSGAIAAAFLRGFLW